MFRGLWRFTTKLEETLKTRSKTIDSDKQSEELPDPDEELFSRPLVDETPIHVPYEQWDLHELKKELGLDGADVEIEEKPPFPDIAEADDVDPFKYISAKVSIPTDGYTFAVGKVIARAKDENGKLVGK